MKFCTRMERDKTHPRGRPHNTKTRGIANVCTQTALFSEPITLSISKDPTMTTERIPTGHSSASDSDDNRSLDGFRIDEDGFRINEDDYLALENIVMDWGRCKRDEWWSKAKDMIDVDKDGRVQHFNCPVLIESLHPSIGRFRSLKELNLDYTDDLTSLPDEIGNLGSLVKLSLYSSAIISLPPSIGRLGSLKELNLNYTYGLTSLPEEIGNLGSLVKLSLDGSAIISLHPSIGRLRSLKGLDLKDTEHMTSLPDEIGNLGSLIKLSLYHSAIISLPPSIGRLRSLKELDLDHTYYLTSLPEEIGDLGSLIKLSLEGSGVESLPHSIGRLGSLKELYLGNTEELTSLPEEIGNLGSLFKLSLDGSLPYSINYALSCAARVPIGTHLFSAKGWPVILANATRAFRSKILYNTTNNHRLRLKPQDAIYRVLSDYSDSFVGFLANRNNKHNAKVSGKSSK